MGDRAADLDAALERIIRECKFAFSPGEALWFSEIEPGAMAFEWKHGRIGPSLDSRVRKRRHAVNLNDILYLAGLVELGPVRGPKWREELRRGFPRAIRRGAEVFSFGPYPVTMAPIRRRLRRRLRRLVAMRGYVTGKKPCLFVTGTAVSPFLIARRLDAGERADLLRDHPELTDRDLRRALRYASLHIGQATVADYRAPMRVLATTPLPSGSEDRSLVQDLSAGATFVNEDTPLNVQAWRAKYAGR